jgi:hypothetical protein
MHEHFSLIRDIFGARDYEARCALIEKHLDQIDEDFVDAFGMILEMEGFTPPEKLVLAYLCARTLSHVSCLHAKRGGMQVAKRFAMHSLQAFQRAFYLPNKLGIEECAEMTTSHLEVLLAYAGELRGLGLEEGGWQAYWIADPIFAAIETPNTLLDLPVGKLLTAALTLEQVGMPEKARDAWQKAHEQAGSNRRFQQEKKLAEKLAVPPTEIPAPDVYAGDSKETAYRFTSQRVGIACVQQTRCPRCRGPLRYVSKALVGSASGKVYDKYTMECENNSRHPAVTIYKDASREPLLGHLASKLGPLPQLKEEEYKATPRSTRKVSYPSKKEKVIFNVVRAIITVLITAVASAVSALIAWELFHLLGLPSPYWQVLLGNIAGYASGFAVYFASQFIASLPAALKGRSVEPTPLRTGLLAILGMATGATTSILIGGWASGASLLVLLAIFWLMKKLYKGST